MYGICQSNLPDATHATHVEIIYFKKNLAKSKLINKILYSLGRTTVPTSIVNIIGWYIFKRGWGSTTGPQNQRDCPCEQELASWEYTIMLLSFTTI